MLFMSILILLISNAVSNRRDKSILYSRIAIIILISCLFISFYSFDLKLYDKGVGLFGGLYQATIISHTFHIFIFIISIFIIQLNGFYPRKVLNNNLGSIFNILFVKLEYFNLFILNKMSQQYKIIEYPLIILFIIMGGIFLISSADLISIFLSIELQSYGLYILCAIYRNSERATSGALTYFLLGGLSSCFILLGSSLIYGNSGTTGFDGLYIINNISGVDEDSMNTVENLTSFYESNYFNFALSIISIGFLFKISAAPFHFWSPDVYDAVPTIVTTFVAVFAKISILVLLLELVHFTNNMFVSNLEFDTLSEYFNVSWTFTILISSFLSLIIGSILGLTQSRIKRLYAYSTISHIGFILLAISINTVESTQSFIFYLMQYSISNVNAFLLLIAVGYTLYLFIEKKNNYSNENSIKENKLIVNEDISDRNNSPVQLITDIKGFFYINPFLSVSLGITLFSFVGIPPLIGFFAKQMVLTSALDNGYIFMSIVAILTSVISAYYYLVIVKQIFFEKSDNVLNRNFFNLKSLQHNYNNAKLTEHNISNHLETHKYTTNEGIYLTSNLTSAISILTLTMLLFIFAPQEWLNITTIISLIIFNF